MLNIINESIIKAASSQLGALALICLLLSSIVLIFFNRSSDKIRLSIFIFLSIGICSFAYLIIMKKDEARPPTPIPTPIDTSQNNSNNNNNNNNSNIIANPNITKINSQTNPISTNKSENNDNLTKPQEILQGKWYVTYKFSESTQKIEVLECILEYNPENSTATVNAKIEIDKNHNDMLKISYNAKLNLNSIDEKTFNVTEIIDENSVKAEVSSLYNYDGKKEINKIMEDKFVEAMKRSLITKGIGKIKNKDTLIINNDDGSEETLTRL